MKNRQGEICLFLALVGSGEPVDVHYKFKLINPLDSTKSVTRGEWPLTPCLVISYMSPSGRMAKDA